MTEERARSLGKLAPLDGRGLAVVWRGDDIEAVTLRAMGPVGGPPLGHVATAIKALAKLPAARALSSLRVLRTSNERLPSSDAWHRDRTHSRTCAAIADARLPLCTLALDDYDMDFDAHDYDGERGRVAEFFQAIAGVEHLTLRCRRFTSSAHPSTVTWPTGLRSLRLEAQSRHRAVLRHLDGITLPALARLDLWISRRTLLIDPLERDASREPIDAWLTTAHERFPALTHLGFSFCEDAEIFELLVRAPIAKQLQSLSFTGGAVSTAALERLADLPELRALDLTECGLDDSQRALAERLVPGARTWDGRPATRVEGAIVRIGEDLRVCSGWMRHQDRPRTAGDEAYASLILLPRPLG